MSLLKLPGRLRPWVLLASVLFLGGCQSAILNPKGQIGIDERNLLVTCTVLMLLVVVPVIVMALVFAYRYRASKQNRYEPEWHHSTPIEIVVWAIPCVIITVLGVLVWRSSHALDPYRPLDSDVPPVTIQAVSLDWKWLFIYPEQNVAAVNEMAFPEKTPLNFRITSDSVMNAFFIPELGTMIYSMAGMETKLHLIANEQGDLRGMSSHYSGQGFSGMQFKAISTDQAGFEAWIAKARASGKTLDDASYAELAKPSENVAPIYYASVKPELFNGIIAKYMMGSHGKGGHKMLGMDNPAEPGTEAAQQADAHAGDHAPPGAPAGDAHDGHDMQSMDAMPGMEHMHHDDAKAPAGETRNPQETH
ncbi:ubiquinol oxidase subunit II [Pseudoxanthomonas winnipegensis]|uniref:Cytochrome bo(3) ubiquinol oxidase subunit 2 n=1 Tax=Pseudoxanthomonas winnipegensis TaxID=2480810 RepID=A0A4Q8LVU6_9GAMM|nr:ubiquinol oxidase subunit II [Pseudoxanthomonas winnipegensis]TAA36126.1 ubiquinol oxidase subunit II [Pseudoxanthomonas winnipegensis]